MSKALLTVLALGAGLLASNGALAHAVLVDSTPAVKSEVPAKHVEVKLHYNSRIDAKRSRLVLKGKGKTLPLEVAQGKTEADIGASADNLAPGPYVLHWDVLSVDGHVSRGQIPFTAVESK
jgi:methionine-rich copper-binding protein CopC